MNKVYFGDCRTILPQLASDGVKAQMCVTSPPYFGLRNYCDGQIGLEDTPENYIANMVEVFRLVRDVLTDTGTLWLNIGDTYARTGGTDKKISATALVGSTRNTLKQMGDRTSRAPAGLKDKDLIGIPWMLALALRKDGWYLCKDIIWHKPNSQPESMKDRCTKSHEYIFLLSKSSCYFATYVDTVWSIPTQPYRGAHFATYPVALAEKCILAGSMDGDVVIDPFMGSGTTAVAALQNSRKFIGCELNNEYQVLQNQRLAEYKKLTE